MPESPMEPLASKPAYYHGHPRYGFRGDSPAEIIGVRMAVTKYGQRACFMICYPDGYIDYCPIEDIKSYEIKGNPADALPR